MKKLIIPILIIIFFIGVIIWCFNNVKAEQLGADKIPDHLKLKVNKDNIIFSKEKDGIVEYLYNSGVEIEKERYEKIEMRTKNAKFFDKGNGKIEGRFYAGEPFYQKNGKWYQTETATTTKEVFEQVGGLSLGASGDPVYGGAGDGTIIKFLNPGYTWTNVHDATSASADYDDTFEGQFVQSVESSDASSYYSIARGFLPIDTSALPDDATINGAVLNLRLTLISNQDNDGDDFIRVVQTDQPDPTVLGNDDYNNCGSTDNPVAGANDVDLGDMSANSYNAWTLNDVGIGWISKTGYTMLGMREGHDVLDHTPANNTYNYIGTRLSEYADTTSDPYLTIEYTTPSTGDDTFATFTIKNGTLQIKNGTINIK